LVTLLITPPPSTAFALAVTEKSSEVMQSRSHDMSDDCEDEYLTALQTILDNLGLNSKESFDRLSNCIIDGAEFDDLVSRLSVAMNMSYEQAKEKLMERRSSLADVRA
jgi:hypothetical protein